jgi:hypothetical protein
MYPLQICYEHFDATPQMSRRDEGWAQMRAFTCE